MNDEIERYRWVDEEPRNVLDAVSLTFVKPASDTLIEVLGPRGTMPRPLTFAAALDAAFALDDYASGSLLVQLDELDGWTTIIEPCGWAATMPDVVARLSTSGIAVNVFWNVNANMSACLARDGQVVRQFDPLLYEAGDSPLEEELGLPFGDPAAPLRAVSVAFLARVTGVRFDEAWLLEPERRTFVVPVP
jgi:hypothetical protein